MIQKALGKKSVAWLNFDILINEVFRENENGKEKGK